MDLYGPMLDIAGPGKRPTWISRGSSRLGRVDHNRGSWLMAPTDDTRQRRVNVGKIPSRSLPKQSASRTLTWTEIPEWQRDNDYILTGYRQWVVVFLFTIGHLQHSLFRILSTQNSWTGCVESLFGCKSEFQPASLPILHTSSNTWSWDRSS